MTVFDLPNALEHAEGHRLQHTGDVTRERQSVEPHAFATRRQDLDADDRAVGGVVDAPCVIEPNLLVPLGLLDRDVGRVDRLVLLEKQVLGHSLRPLRHTVTTRPS